MSNGSPILDINTVINVQLSIKHIPAIKNTDTPTDTLIDRPNHKLRGDMCKTF